MNNSRSTVWMWRCCSTRKYRGNRNSYASITAGAVRLIVCRTREYNLARNSAFIDKQHDAFVQYAIAWPTP